MFFIIFSHLYQQQLTKQC